jgi:predicted Zn-dependent protease
MSTTSLAKAVIVNLDQGGNPIPCMFNPKEYTFTKQNKWSEGKNSGKDVPQLEFSSGQPSKLKMQLLFDTYFKDQQTDVREYTDGIWELMMVDQNLVDPKTQRARPPMVRFQWGKTWSFDAVIINISQKFILFLDDGTPVRAQLDVTFQQIKDSRQLRPQNPTSGGTGGEQVWTVKEGETLAWIAYKVYRDSNQWRKIAQHNRLTSVRQIAPGTVLEIPNA